MKLYIIILTYYFILFFNVIIAVSKIKKLKHGPCFLSTRSKNNRLKCTEEGFFEVKQCVKNYCVCVDPATGYESISTKTKSINQLPVCGKCHLQLAKILREPITEITKLPQCVLNTGKFQLKQCDNEQSCFCVDENTGIALSNKPKSNKQLNCNIIFNESIDSVPITKTSKAFLSIKKNYNLNNYKTINPPVASPICLLKKDHGKSCNNQSSSIKWYFDKKTFECLAFKYEGCNGNMNRFDTVSECWRSCKLADFGGCAGLKAPAKNSKGDSIICYSQEIELEKCPKNYQCTMLAFFGVCCEKKNQELYQKNYFPTCKNNKSPIKIDVKGLSIVLIGKNCSDNFCPNNSKCYQKEIFAHCCEI